jgi:RNA polymerase sigma factor (sigma-70 family)
MREIGLGRSRTAPRKTETLVENRPVTEFEKLAMPLVNSAHDLARWLVRNDHDAEDLVQETYLKALRSFSSFQSGTNFRAWLFRILRNTFLSSCLTLERRMTVEMNWEDDLPCLRDRCACPESQLIERNSIAAIRGAIEQLPFSGREVILLCHAEELSYQEIARMLQIPMGTVMSRLARARKVVRDALRLTLSDRNQRPVSLGTRTRTPRDRIALH